MKYIFLIIILSSASCFLMETKPQKKTYVPVKSSKEMEKYKDLKTDFDKANHYYGIKDYKQAFYWYEKAAKQNYFPAQFAVGVMYFEGRGVPRNYKKAFYWYEKAAKQGEALAQLHMGMMYNTGQGVARNDKQAFYWCEKAAKQGAVPAQLALGMMYLKGTGTSQSQINAYAWFSLAALNGDKKSLSLRDKIASGMSPKQITEAKRFSSQIAQEVSKTQSLLQKKKALDNQLLFHQGSF